MRWLVTAVVALVAAAAGLLAGYVHWGTGAPGTHRLEQRLESTQQEAATLRAEKEELAQRLRQLSTEQERLAQENEILRKDRTTDQLLGEAPGALGTGGELPVIPPK